MIADDSLPLLQLVRERIAPERNVEYDTIERAIALACRNLGGPHPYLALRNVGDPREVWWINRFASAAERQQVIDAYAGNARLMEAVARLAERKALCVESSTDVLLRSSGPDHEGHAALGTTTRVVAAWSSDVIRDDVWTFAGADGLRLSIALADSAPAAQACAHALGWDAITLAVVADWSLASRAWVAANAALWRG